MTTLIHSHSPIESVETTDQQQVCSCYDVMRLEIVEVIQQGADSVEKVSDITYACQGCGGCREQIELMIEQYLPVDSGSF